MFNEPAMEEKSCARNPRGLRNVLIVRFSAIGDVAMTVPSVYSVCRAYPDVRFVFVTRKSMVSIFINRPENLVVYGVDLKNEYKGVRGVARLFSRVRKEFDIDGIVDLHDVLRTKIIRTLGRLKGIPSAKINKGRGSKRALTRSENKVMLQLETSLQRYRDTFVRFGFPADESFNGLFGDSHADAALYAAITAPRPEGEQWIGIAPFAKHKGKIYPEEMMEEVVRELSRHENLRIFLFGGGEHEAKVLSEWASKYPRVKSLASERHGFGVELALLSNLDCMVSMDSANMHLASIAGIPVVSIWGATHPYCGFKGWHQKEDNMIQLPLTCRPCSVFGDKPCHRGDYLCLTGIKPQIIIDRVVSLLDGPSA